MLRTCETLPWSVADESDGDLLGRFIHDKDESAFAEIVRRHGLMVLGVCQRVLGDPHAAEDVFQATFLVLVQRAASIGTRQPLGGWLYAVAQRIALKARAQSTARRERERRRIFRCRRLCRRARPAHPHQVPSGRAQPPSARRCVHRRRAAPR